MKKTSLIVVISIVFGLIIGLIVASSFNVMQEGLAEGNISPVPMTAPIGQNQTSTPQAESAPIINSDLEATSRAFVQIAKRATPSVVSITSEKVVKVRDPFADFFNDDFFRRFFRGRGNGEQEFRQQGLGSGVIVSSEGYILTNYHVIREADEISVLIEGKQYTASIVGTDPETDLAVVKVDKEGLPAISLGDSEKLEVGEWVLAIGSPFDLRLEHTVTSGIISAKGRSLSLSRELTYQDFIQTDAAINPGNSGGALVNIRGELIGINTAIYAGNTGGNLGIGFAIPINLAKGVMNDLIEHGKVYRGYLGVFIETPDEETIQALGLKGVQGGAIITEVQPDTPAERAGLKKYDVIIEVDGTTVTDRYHLTNMIGAYAPNSKIRLKIVRDGKERTMTVLLAERPGANVALETPDRQSTSGRVEKLGLELADLTPNLAQTYGYEDEQGVLITNVRAGSPADRKGLLAGALIKEINRERVSSVREAEIVLNKLANDEIVLFQVMQGQRNRFVAIRLQGE